MRSTGTGYYTLLLDIQQEHLYALEHERAWYPHHCPSKRTPDRVRLDAQDCLDRDDDNDKRSCRQLGCNRGV